MSDDLKMNRVIYKKTFDKPNEIVHANFIIVNNNKVTCQLHVKDGILLPTTVLKNNDINLQYVTGLREAIPSLIRYSVHPKEIQVDVISERFDTNLITNDADNIIQYGTSPNSNTIDQFYKVETPDYNVIDFQTKSNPNPFEERLYLNFKKGFVFSIINKEHRLIYLYVQNYRESLIGELCSQKDIGAVSRIMKYWPELQISITLQNMEATLKSSTINNLIPAKYNTSGILYMFNRHGSSKVKLMMPYFEVK